MDDQPILIHFMGMKQDQLCGMAVRLDEKPEWINKNDRMPKEEDYKGGNGYIQVWLDSQNYNYPMHVAENSIKKDTYLFTYWRPVPPLPKPVNQDGSLVISSKLLEAIAFQILKAIREQVENEKLQTPNPD